MTVKRNRWLVVSVLVVAIGAFLTISLLPLFAGRSNHSTATAPTTPPSGATDVQAELEARARGYELVLEREPDNQIALQGLVDARIELARAGLTDLTDVVEPLERLSELSPEVLDYQIILGQVKQQLGDLDGAAQAYRTVLTSSPGDPNALQALVFLLIRQNRPQAAIGLLEDTLNSATQTNEVNPGTINVTLVKELLAQVYIEEERMDEALRIYDEVLETANDDTRFRLLASKALVLREMGQAAEAEVLFAQAEELAPAEYKDQIRQMAAGPESLEGLPTEEGVPPEEAGAAEDTATPESENVTEPDATNAPAAE